MEEVTALRKGIEKAEAPPKKKGAAQQPPPPKVSRPKVFLFVCVFRRAKHT